MEKILVFMNNRKNSEMIGDFFGLDYEVIHLEKENLDDLNGDFSLFITDLPSWSKNKNILKSRKENEEPLFLPYLLVTHVNDIKLMNNR